MKSKINGKSQVSCFVKTRFSIVSLKLSLECNNCRTYCGRRSFSQSKPIFTTSLPDATLSEHSFTLQLRKSKLLCSLFRMLRTIYRISISTRYKYPLKKTTIRSSNQMQQPTFPRAAPQSKLRQSMIARLSRLWLNLKTWSCTRCVWTTSISFLLPRPLLSFR